ncbi:hypothetical protein, conserved [Eimeria maxima]|uniref:Proteophosphoglycan ppg4, related n=1 Tax=Eimeria maxima TaxID=5804 RepID=U6MDQ6_EIMMA|nr:hypothetical protein, conserved [Eimeria maxima]CDJ61188.1 hypothetical protein, conserved [Eimeria maxima]
MSPLMRRASPSGCGSITRSLDDFAKGMTRPNSTSSMEDARTCGDVGDFVPVDLKNDFLQRRRSHPGRSHPMNSESPLSTASTPTRSTTRSTGETNADSTTSDAERVHEKLQQMWDDGELSPRAPLDRSLGYISSPNNSGKGAASASIASEGTSGGAQSCRQISQQGIVAPLFINDVRALRQMAPFSSTEEQVLTRSQRRRSSANLLQQLVAAQPGGSVHLGHAEVAVQQEQGIVRKEQRQQHETDSSGQLQDAQCDLSTSQQHQYASQMVVEALDLSVGQACRSNSLGSGGAVSRCTVARKRRASSPVVSTDSFSAHEYHKKSDGGLPPDGAPLYGCRKRLSAPRTSMQTLATADATPASSKTSPRRSSATTAVPYTGGNGDSGVFDIAINCTNNNSSSSSSTLESPFQKHPPPSPSDFPVSSPIGTSSYTPRREASAEPKQQTHQMQSHETSATSDLPAVCGPAGKDKNPLSSPLRTSPRRTHGEGGPSFPPFQTPRGPCNVQEPQDDTMGTCIRQRASQRCPSPVPLVPTGTPNKRAVADQRGGGPPSGDACEQSISPASEDGHENVRAITLRAPSTKKVTVLPRRASVVPASRLKAAPRSSNTSVVPVMSNREAETANGVAGASGINKPASSPRKTEIPVSTWHRPVRSGAGPTRVGVTERQRKSQLISAASLKYTSDRFENAPSESHPKNRYPNTRDPGDSLAATALPRRRSTTRRSIGLASSAGPSSSWVPTSLADRRSASASPVASQEVTGQAPAQITARSPVQFAKAATTQGRMPMARLGNQPSGASGAGAHSLGSSRSQVAGVCLGASIGEPSSTKASAQGKAVTLAAVRKGLPRATPLRPSVAKPRANSSKSLFHSATARSSANMLPITKPRVLIPASARHKTQGGGAVRGVRNSRGKYPTCNSCSRGVTSVAPSRHGRPAVKGHSSMRTRAGVHLDDSAATKSPGGNASGFKVDAKDSGHAEKDARIGEFRSNCLSPPELSSASDEISLPQAQPQRALTEEEHRRSCTNSTICCPTVSSSVHSTAGIGVSAPDACPALAQSSWDTGTPYHPSRRRSSSPHNLALQKCTSNEAGDGRRPSGPLAPLRRASSVCSLEDGDGKRISAQQQKNEALHQVWEGRDREYQEKQQKLLLEQQRKERLLAWEQREAELLKNRKALSKEEPSFWGFDPFMVDEEDEKVLTTEELRVEVSRFLKGDLRFHSRADLLRVVKKFSEQTRTTTTTTSSRLNFTKVDQRVVPMAARQVHGTVPHERRRKSILRNSSGSQQPSEGRTRSRGISFSPFNKVQLYMLDEHERASKEAAAHLSQQGEQRQQLRQKLAHQFQLMLLRGDSDLELSLIRRELASLCDPDEEDSIAFLSPTLAPGRDGEPESKGSFNLSQQGGAEVKLNDGREPTESVDGNGIGRLPFTVSPSWRQRPHNVWQDTPGASQTEPCAEWSPPLSPIEHSRLNNVGAKEGNGCWRTPIAGAGSEVEGKRELGTSENDENANYNAVKSSSHLHSEASGTGFLT